MWFDLPPRKYRNFPRKLVGNHRYKFRDSKGRLSKFRRNKRLTLYLPFKTPQAYLDYLLYLYPPKARKPRKTAPKAVRLPWNITPVTSTVFDLLGGLGVGLPAWTSAEEVMADLEARYEGIEYDRASAMRGWRYEGPGPYHHTFWPTQEIKPFKAKSFFLFVVVNVRKVSPKIGDAFKFVLACRHVGWKAPTTEIAEKLIAIHPEKVYEHGKLRTKTNLEELVTVIFRKAGGNDYDNMEVVGMRFGKTIAPDTRKLQNPYKQKR